MGEFLDFGNIYPNALNFATVGIMAVVFISVMKFLTTKYNIPGISSLLASI